MSYTIPISYIQAEDRQRSSMDATKLRELRDSIVEVGLLHPIVVWKIDDDHVRLLAGERRLRAITRLHEEGVKFRHNGKFVPPDAVPVTFFHVDDEALHAEVEYAENEFRDPLSWQDRTAALVRIQQLKRAEDPTKTATAIARELSAASGSTKTPASVHNALVRATVIQNAMSNPAVANARTESEAYALALKEQAERVQAVIIRRRQDRRNKQGKLAVPIILRAGDSLKLLPQLEAGQFDVIITDPPYGIGANSLGARGRTVHHHNYEDTWEHAQRCIRAVLLEGFRVTKPRANIFIFCSSRGWAFAREEAMRIGWVPYPEQLIWQKSHSEGLAPWGGRGPRRTWEGIFLATKGQKFLLSSPVDIFDFPRVSRAQRIYGAQKPIELLQKLIELSTVVGERVLDPFAGSGSTLRAARLLEREALGIEISPEAVETATTYIFADDPTLEEEDK